MKPLTIDDLPPEIQAQVRKDNGLGSGRRVRFSIEDVRRFALRAMASLAALDQAQRVRVLKHCLKINQV